MNILYLVGQWSTVIPCGSFKVSEVEKYPAKTQQDGQRYGDVTRLLGSNALLDYYIHERAVTPPQSVHAVSEAGIHSGNIVEAEMSPKFSWRDLFA